LVEQGLLRFLLNTIILRKIKMQKIKNKTMAIMIAVLLAFSMLATMALVPTVSSADSIPTYAFLSAAPNPVGVGQEVTILMWLDKANPTASGPQGGRFQGFALKITEPDGTTENRGPFTADPTSFAYLVYTPDQIGNYTIKFDFPGQQVTGIGGFIPVPVNDYYEPSSYTSKLIVQQEPAISMPMASLPTNYWARPINSQNQDWYTISGNWLGIGPSTFGNTLFDISGNFNPYSAAPNSPHIVWTKPLSFGGLIGGQYGGTTESNYYTGKSYEPLFTPPVIMNGIIYYNEPLPPKNGYYAVDLRTGETLWYHASYGPVTQVGAAGLTGLGTPAYSGISCGQIFAYRSPNEVGSRAYLWFSGVAPPAGLPGVGSWYYMYSAETGDLILEMQNVTAGGSRVQGPSGELLYYFLGNNWLAMWNSTKAIGTGSQSSTGLWTWRPPVGAVLDWRKGIQWNVTVPNVPGQAIASIDNGTILATTGNQFMPFNSQMEVAYDMKTGNQLWIQNRTTAKGATAFSLMGRIADGVYTEYDKGALQWRGFSIYTGQPIWGPTAPLQNPWDSQPYAPTSAYGNLYTRTMAGVHALDLKTGKILWDFYPDPSGNNFPGMPTYPMLAGEITIADGKIFAPTGNSHGDPLFRGARLYAINATDGKQIWNINGFFLSTLPVADGYLVGHNGYDDQIYCFGKGQTATTIVTSPEVSMQGSSILIQGMVTDESSGTKNTDRIALFPNGVPAIADENMSPWMEYVYQQQPKPTNATGVPVILSVVDANGNYREIGTTTSDLNGFYSYQWTPDIEGKYTVTAAFTGSESYWPSQSTTAFAVEPTAPTPTPSPAIQSIADQYFVPAIAGIIVAIAIVGAVLTLLLLRKRPQS
jgi:hypothetical protein